MYEGTSGILNFYEASKPQDCFSWKVVESVAEMFIFAFPNLITGKKLGKGRNGK